ncbi:MAG: TRAP transporter substrate-binding protein [Sphaerochaetaceae bacterium]|nr:TRAP transporter substrate-binding protein [Sphaerochaetaceae bacterium]
MKKILTVMLIACVAFMAFANGGSEAATGTGIAGTTANPRILKAGTSAPASTDTRNGYYVFEKLMNEKLMELSGGTIGYECVYGGALGNNTQLLAQLKAGTLDFMPTGFDLATNLQNSEKFYAVSMPYVFDNDAHMDAFLESDLWKEMVEELKQSNGIYIAGLAMHQTARSFNTKKPIVHPEDLKNLKIRVPESTVQMEMWKATGASPMVVPASELYTSLDSGVVEGQENDIVASAVTLKLYEVAPYFTETDYIKQACLLYMSAKTYDAMTEQEKAWFEEALDYACAEASQCYYEKYDAAKEEIVAHGGTIVEFDFDEWKTYFSDLVHNVFDGKYFPAGLYDQIQATPY